MSNGDDAMTSAEFAKLMGAYPEPAGNPLPTYGGFMDNSAANFAWVNNNDYFGAESFEEEYECSWCGKDVKKGDKFYFVDGAWTTDALCVSCKEEGDDEDADWGKLNIEDGTWDAETFGAFSIDKDDEGKIHIENKCDGCEKEFLFTQNSNIVGGNRAGAIVYENLDGITGHDYPEYSPYGDLLCKSCWKEGAENDWENFSRMAETFDEDKYIPRKRECEKGCKGVCNVCWDGERLDAESEYEVVHLKGGHLVAKFIHIDCPMSKEIDGWDVEDGEIQFFDPDDYPTGVCATCGKSITLSDKDNAWVQTWYEDEETFSI